jgi:NADH:ubiquinone oxidoreductase subunit H
MEDWVVFRTWVGDLTQMIADNTVGKTRLSDYSDGAASFMTESIMAVTIFGTIMGTILALLWIERTFFARIMDRRGATMGLR